tara:strand:+ start:146 stop:328 length:183 start_codon:yes stop_codon:yes gene_type:complete
LGSLVRIRQDIKEFTDLLGGQTGIVIRVEEDTEPELLDILWSSGEIEKLYSDEIEVLQHK